MEVTNGLLSNLVETKSIQRVLSPIASHVSQLIIHTEHTSLKQEFSETRHINLNQSADDQVIQSAVDRLIASVSSVSDKADSTLIDVDELNESCDQLREAADSLSLACTRMMTQGRIPEVSRSLVLTAKHLLQATMKVLLLVDSKEVTIIRVGVHRVKEKLGLLLSVQQMVHIAPAFKVFLDAVTHLAVTSHRRQSDMICDTRRDKIVTSLLSMKKSLPLLNAAIQNCVKYPSNVQAQATRDYAVNEIKNCIDDILDAVTNRLDENDESLSGETGSFITNIDKIIQAISEDQRDTKCDDLETWLDAVIQHAMCVAHLCTDSHRDVVVKACQRILHQKTRVFELACLRRENVSMLELRCDYDESCDTLTDDLCDLECSVNTALLYLIVTGLYQSTAPLDHIVDIAQTNGESPIQPMEAALEKFCQFSDIVCQIGRLASYSTNNTKRVQAIRGSIQRLEQLDPEVTPAALSCLEHPHDKAARHHIKLLRREWSMEFGELMKTLDEMVDPRIFLDLSEQLLRHETDQCVDAVQSHDLSTLYDLEPMIVGKTERVVQVSKRLLETHEDPVFRNALRVHVDRLRKTLSSLRDSCRLLKSNPDNFIVMDTIARRLHLIVEGVNHVRSSVDGNDGLHILHPRRKKSPNKSQQVIDENISISKMMKNDENICVTFDDSPDIKHAENSEEFRYSETNSLDDNSQNVKIDVGQLHNDSFQATTKFDESNQDEAVNTTDRIKDSSCYGVDDVGKIDDSCNAELSLDQSGMFYSATDGDLLPGQDNPAYCHDDAVHFQNSHLSSDSFFSQPIYDPQNDVDKESPPNKAEENASFVRPPRPILTYEQLTKDNAVARTVCDMHQRNTDIEQYLNMKAPVNVETSLEMLDTAQQIVQYAATFKTQIQDLADHCTDETSSKDLNYHVHQVTMATSQLDIMSKLLLSAANSLSAYEGVVRTSRRLMTTIVDALNSTESVCLQCFPTNSETQSQNAPVTPFLELIDWKRNRVKQLDERHYIEKLDDLGLQRLEYDNRYSITDCLLPK